MSPAFVYGDPQLYTLSAHLLNSRLTRSTMPPLRRYKHPRRKIICGCAEPEPPKPKAPRAPRKKLTAEEKDEKKQLAERKTEWQALLQAWTEDRDFRFPLETIVSPF